MYAYKMYIIWQIKHDEKKRRKKERKKTHTFRNFVFIAIIVEKTVRHT